MDSYQSQSTRSSSNNNQSRRASVDSYPSAVNRGGSERSSSTTSSSSSRRSTVDNSDISYHVTTSQRQQMTQLRSTKVKNIVMMCTALAIIVASAIYIIGEQQKIGGLRRHDHQNQYRDNKFSRALRFMSPVPLWPDMGKEKERKSLERAQYDADHHEDERNLGKRNNKKKQKKKKKKKRKPKAEKLQSLKGSTATTASANIVKDMAVAVVESSSEPKSSKSDKAMTNTEEELTSYALPFQKDTVSV